MNFFGGIPLAKILDSPLLTITYLYILAARLTIMIIYFLIFWDTNDNIV
jgi:hypothetical protein